MPIPDYKYAKLSRFVRNIIVDAGYSKSSGNPNVSAFYEAHKHCFAAGDLSISPASFAKFANGLKSDPDGSKMEALAIILSSASDRLVTVGELDALVDRRSLAEFEGSIDTALVPTDLDAAEAEAEACLERLKQLRLEARSVIAPRILMLLGRDWEYLEAQGINQISYLLQAELNRRGVGLEEFASKILNGRIPLNKLRDIRECRMPAKLLKPDECAAFCEVVRSIDGGQLTESEMEFLTLPDQRERRP